jgi:outer membrane protein OmpA-like peptidoglycan-associated protein
MIKKMLLVAVTMLVSGSMLAQTKSSVEEEFVTYETDKYKVETNKFWSNWFISVGGGAQMLFGDHEKQMKFADRLSPALDVAIGKWFTPGIGIRFMYSGLSWKGVTQNGAYGNGKVYDASKWLEEQEANYFNLHGDVLFNLSNLFCGYNEKRIWNVSPYVSLGWARMLDAPKTNEITGSLGLINSFRLCSSLDLQIDVRGTVMNDRFDGETGGRSAEGILSATVGLTYKFPKRGWNKVKTPVYNDALWNEYRGKMNNLNAENERLKALLAEANSKPAETKVEKQIVVPDLIVTFRIGKSALTKEDRVNLGFLAKAIKEGDPKATYTITGYADAGTGSKKINEHLSKARAAAVYSCLVNEFGVDKSQLRVRHEGGVDNMFYDDPRLSRAAILRNK